MLKDMDMKKINQYQYIGIGELEATVVIPNKGNIKADRIKVN